MKVPQLRNAKKKSGFNATQLSNNAGFGLLHDGSVDSLERFIAEPVFTVNSDQEVADRVAFVFCISGGDLPAGGATFGFPPGPPSQETPASVGQQTTLVSAASPETGQLALISSMISLANANKVGLVVKGIYHGQHRGFMYAGANVFQSDKAAETVTAAALQASAAPGSELTYTVVFKGTEQRIGIDRDLDGVFDGDVCPSDFNHDLAVDFFDYLDFVNAFSTNQASADFNNDGVVDFFDYLDFVDAFSSGC
jgi:hypothetical protein